MVERFAGDPNIEWDEDLYLDGDEEYYGGLPPSAAELFDAPDGPYAEEIYPKEWDLDEAERKEIARQAESKAEIDRIYELNGEERFREGSLAALRGLPRVFRRVDAGEPDSPHYLVLKYLGLASGMARRWGVPESLQRSDLFQVGVEGLMRAAEKHDPSISSYANYAGIWVRNKIGREIRNNDRTIRIEGGLLSRVSILECELSKFVYGSRQMPVDAAEIYELTKDSRRFTKDQVDLYLSFPVADVGLDEIPQPKQDDPGFSEVETEMMREWLCDLVIRMAIGESGLAIFLANTGLDGFPELTHAEIAAERGVTRSAITGHHSRFLARIKDLLEEFRQDLV